MMGGRVVLCEVVCQVCISSFPVDSELALSDSIFHPVKLHIYCLGVLGLDLVIGKSICDLVVGLNGQVVDGPFLRVLSGS